MSDLEIVKGNTNFRSRLKRYLYLRSNVHGCQDKVSPRPILDPLRSFICKWMLILFKSSVYAELGIKEGDAHIIRNAGGVAYVAQPV